MTEFSKGGIAANQVIARSEFEVHRQIYKEWMWRRLWLVHICDRGDLCRYFDIYPMYSVAFVVWWIITQWHLPLVDIWGRCIYCNWHFVWIWWLPLWTSCKSLKWYVTVCFLGLFVNGMYHTACRYSGPMVWNSASVTFLKICYYGRKEERKCFI